VSDDKPPDDFVDFLVGVFAVLAVVFVLGCMVVLAVNAT
jgi:hypothetical protein